MKSLLSADSLLARYGGDEFVALVSDVSGEHIKFIVEQLRHSVEITDFVVDGNIFKTTISIGVSKYEKNPAEFLSIADKALYESKHKGKNLVSFFF